MGTQEIRLDKDMGLAEINDLIKDFESGDVQETDKMVMKELISSKGKDIHFKTELKPAQIKAITKLIIADKIIKAQDTYCNDKEKGRQAIESIITELNTTFMQLQVSKERKGRAEFIDAWKGGNLKDRLGGLMNRFTGTGQNI